MLGQTRVLSLILIACLSAGGAAGPREDRGAPRVQSATGASDDKATLQVELSIDEAISAAIEAVDRLGFVEGGDATATIVEDIQRYAETIRAMQPDNPWLRYVLGCAYGATGRRGDAIDLLYQFVETREGRNEWRAHRVLGDLFVEEFPRLARANYKKAAALKEDEPAVLFGLSMCAVKVGEYDEAARFARRAVAADGRRNTRYLNHLTKVLMDRRLWTEAKQEAEAALRRAEESVRSQPGKRGPLELLDAQYELLVDVCMGLTRETPHEAEHYLEAARYLRRRADNSTKLARHDALDVLELGVKQTAPNTSAVLLQEYAKALALVDRRDAAIAEFDKLLAADPSNTTAAEWLSRLRKNRTTQDSPP